LDSPEGGISFDAVLIFVDYYLFFARGQCKEPVGRLELGISQTHLSRRLPLNQPEVSNAVKRGVHLVRERQYSIEPKDVRPLFRSPFPSGIFGGIGLRYREMKHRREC